MYCMEHGIVVQAYSPLVRAAKMEDATLVSTAKKYGKTPAQVLIRYCLQKGWVPLPKSEKEHRIRENVDVYDFRITDEDMEMLDDLDGKL
jgi:diketogulonate reductase-like aldo/keto reductase